MLFPKPLAIHIAKYFQDSTQNYCQTYESFSPMVIFGTDYWTQTYPVVGVLRSLFKGRFSKYVVVKDDAIEALEFIVGFWHYISLRGNFLLATGDSAYRSRTLLIIRLQYSVFLRQELPF